MTRRNLNYMKRLFVLALLVSMFAVSTTAFALDIGGSNPFPLANNSHLANQVSVSAIDAALTEVAIPEDSAKLLE